jgi:hypothetical protein
MNFFTDDKPEVNNSLTMTVIETIRFDFEEVCHVVESKRTMYQVHIMANDGVLASQLSVVGLRNIVMNYLVYNKQ